VNLIIDEGREFISTHEFDNQWERMGLDDNDLRKLENEIIKNPKVGKVIQGTGGLRKMRYALEDKGKSGGSRVLYVDFVIFEKVYFIYTYPKGVKEDITPIERKQFKNLITKIEKALGDKK